MPGLVDAAAAFCLDLVVPADVQPVPGAAAGGELPGFDPVVDGPGAAAEPVGGFGDADLAVGGTECRCGELAGAGGPAQVMTPVLQPSRRAASATEISPGPYGSGMGIL